MASDIRSYPSLPDPATHIRLFELHWENANEAFLINCHLSVWPLAESSSYHAICYVWEDVNDNRLILLNGDEFPISKNCYDVLGQLLYLKAARYYWLDAICFYQSDAFEKNDQVINMSHVFGGTSCGNDTGSENFSRNSKFH